MLLNSNILEKVSRLLLFTTNIFNCYLLKYGPCNKDDFPTKCFDKIGCFYTGPPFYDPVFRPISVPPEDHLQTTYLLYTPANKNKAYMLDLSNSSVQESPFDGSLETKMLIEGFIIALGQTDLYKIKDEFFKAGNYNVIIVNWTKSNGFPYYQAVANARKVGALTAYLLTIIQQIKGIDFSSVHLIGHSLGAHAAGFAGKRLNKIGRITGLDPAGPYYQNATKEVRLDKSDAQFVDVIHTNGGRGILEGYGLYENIGNQDFYPNGGQSQPACRKDLIYGTRILGLKADICDHSIAVKYFQYSINNCNFTGVQCDSYERFQEGECTKGSPLVAEMGYHAEPIIGSEQQLKFYLHTSADPPYCLSENSTNRRGSVIKSLENAL